MLNHVKKMLAMFPIEISPADESTGKQAVYATTLDELPESVFERNCEFLGKYMMMTSQTVSVFIIPCCLYDVLSADCIRTAVRVAFFGRSSQGENDRKLRFLGHNVRKYTVLQFWAFFSTRGGC